MSVTLEQQIACVKREIAMRKAVYPKQIERGRLSRGAANRELATMEAVLDTLMGVARPPSADHER